MATKDTEDMKIADVVRMEAAAFYCRKAVTVLDGEDISLGEICKLDSADKAVACGAAANEVQTITPSAATGVDCVQTLTPSVGTNADCVQTVTTAGTQTGGTIRFGVRSPLGDPKGGMLWTVACAWSATEATMTATIQAALDSMLGANVVVLTEIPDTATGVFVFTFSGTGATNRPHGLMGCDVSALTGGTTAAVAMTTKGEGTISAGTYRLGIVKPGGDTEWTAPIAFDGNAAAIIVALDDALGVAGVVATGGPMNGPTAIVLTYSGTGYTNMPHAHALVDFVDLAGCDDISIVMTTPGEGTINAGTWRLGLTTAAGVKVWTQPIAYNGNAAAINTAIDEVIPSTLVVASGGPISTPAAVILTFSGAAYLALPQPMVEVDINDLDGCDSATITETTAGHSAGGDAEMISLGAYAPSGADGSGLFLTRGPCIVDQDQLTVPTGGLANAIVALEALGIVCRDEPIASTVLEGLVDL